MPSTEAKLDWDNQSVPVTVANWDVKNENIPGTGSYAKKAFRLLEWIACKGIIIIDQNKVAGFLINNLDVHGSLLFLCDNALKALPTETKIFVTLESDPEYNKRQLVLTARRKIYELDFMEQIQKIRIALKADLKGKKGRVFLTTDYQTL